MRRAPVPQVLSAGVGAPRFRPWLEFLEERVVPSSTVQFGFASESLLETAGTFTIPVTISAVSGTSTSVPFTPSGSAASGTDYSGLTASPVVIPAGQTTVDITGTLLTPNDGVRTLTFTLGTPSGGSTTLGSPDVNTMTISQQPASPTTLSISNSSTIAPAVGGTVDMDFTVTRTGDLTSQITVGYTTVAGTAQPTTDFTPETGTTTFASGSATATIGIPIFGNGVADNPNRTFSVQLTGITSVFGPPVTFAAQQTFAAGNVPYSVTTADVNGAGLPDLIVANDVSNTVSVLMNTTPAGSTTPSFAAQQTFAVGTSPWSVTTADVNGAGLPDLIVANFGSNTVSVLMNTTAIGSTTPSFAAQQTFAVGTSPDSVTTADVNGDGQPDLLVANYGSSSVSVLMNTTPAGSSTPSFAAQQTFATSEPHSVTTADLNGVGLPDLIVANFGSNTVSVLMNTTTPGSTIPTFAARQTFATGSRPFSVSTADLNGAGLPDVIVANSGSNTVSVLMNTTAAGSTTLTLAAQRTFAIGNPSFVTTADVNGDGLPDLIVASYGFNTVSVLMNTTAAGSSTPTFAAQQTFATGANPISVTMADVNGDGRPDLVVANRSSATVSVLLNTTVIGAATIVPAFPQTSFATGRSPQSVTTADLNGDGQPDLIVASKYSNAVSVLMNTTPAGSTTPSFASQQTFATGTYPYFVTTADLNGAGLPDLIVASVGNNADTVSVLMNTTAAGSTSASFAAQQTFAVNGDSVCVTAADLNGAGLPDLIVTNYNTDTVSVLMNTTAAGSTSASFAAQRTFATGSIPGSVTTADLNGAGLPDLIFANAASNTVSVLMNTTTPGSTIPTFAAQQTFATGANPISVTMADVNGAGFPDLIVANYSSNTVSVLMNTTAAGSTTPSFAAQQTFTTGSDPHSVTTADVNGDGLPDLIVTNYGSNTVSVLLNTTAAGSTAPSFAAQQTFATGSQSQPISVTTADVNGDGRSDLIVENSDSSTVLVLLNTPVTIPGNTATGTIVEGAASISGYDYLVSNTTTSGSLTTSTTGVAITGASVALSGKDEYGDPVSATTTTNGSGQYSFTGLTPSNGSGYTVTETVPTGYNHLGQTSSTSGAVTTPATTPVVSSILLSTNGTSSTDNFFETGTLGISTQPDSATIDDGQSDLLSVIASNGATPYSYQWYIGSSGTTTDPITGATGSTFDVSPTSTTSYWVLVSDADSDTVNSNTAVITVNPALGISTQPASAAIDDGQSDLLSVTASHGTTPYSYQWYIGTSGTTTDPITGATSSAYDASPTSATSYWVLITDSADGTAGAASINSNTAVITVNPALGISTQPASATIDNGQSDLLSVTAGNGTTPYSYQWYTGISGNTSSPINGATGSTFDASPTSATSYWVRVADSANGTAGPASVNSNTATITVNPALGITTQPASAAIDDGQNDLLSVTASNGATPYSYQWYTGVSGNTGSPINGATSSTYDASPTSATSYWVLITDSADGTAGAASVNSNTATITVNPALGITTQPASAAIDDGQSDLLSVTASNGTTPYSYQWYIGTSGVTTDPITGATGGAFDASPTSATSYWVLITDSADGTAGAASINSNTATITVNPALGIGTQPTSATIDNGQSDLLSVTASNGTTPYSYQWYIGTSGVTTDPITGATGNTFDASPTSATSYWVLITDSADGTAGAASINSNTATITVNPALGIGTQPTSATIDNGQSDLLSVTASNGTTPYSYQWYIGTSGVTTDPITGATGNTYDASPTSATNYWVRVTDSANGSAGPASIKSNTATLATASYTVADFKGYGVQFYDVQTSSWQRLSTPDAALVGVDSAGVVYADFKGYGVDYFNLSTFSPAAPVNWIPLVPASGSSDPRLLSVAADGVVAADFAPYGTYLYDPANPTFGWQKLAATNPTVLSVGGNGTLDYVVGDFNPYGVDLYDYNSASPGAARGWGEISSSNATLLAVNSSGAVYGDFEGYGVQLFLSGTTWQSLGTVDASSLAVNSLGQAAFNVNNYGVYLYSSAAGLQSLHTPNASLLTLDVDGYVVGDFPPYGVQFGGLSGFNYLGYRTGDASLLASSQG